MKIKIVADADSAASEAARFIASQARSAVRDHGSFVMAVSGGHTPWLMLRALALEDLAWNAVHVVQVDERIAPAGDPDRNLTRTAPTSKPLRLSIRSRVGIGMNLWLSSRTSMASENAAPSVRRRSTDSALNELCTRRC
jgi:Glucosamine-6-phosphate isomerases/6-phosphogluconolactonase